MKEAESVQHEFIATRVAYSAYGKVSSLNGDPESDIIVEAVKGMI